MDKSEIYAEIFDDYARDKKDAETRAEEYKNKVYKKLPRLKEIDREIRMKGVELFKAAAGHGDVQVFEDFKNLCNKLNFERKTILMKAGIDEKKLEPKYKCGICRDTGTDGTRRCKCFNKRLVAKYYQLSNLEDVLKRENFKNFKYDIFSKNKGKDGISPYDNMRRITAEVVLAIENIDNEPINMLFFGPSGLGKTYMCNCIAKELMDRGHFVIYMSAYELFNVMANVRYNNSTKAEKDIAGLIEMCDLLIIDDLGTEGVNNSTVPEFFNILNTRLREGKSTIISTNLEISELGTAYSERIFSRIMGYFRMFKFIGTDLRLH